MNESPISSSTETVETPAGKTGFHFWRCFWLTFLVISLAAAWYSFYVPANSIAWADSFTSGQQQAADSGKPMILYFTGTWCVPCRIMKRQVWADDEVKASVNSEFIPVAIDVDDPESALVMERYNVTGPPVTIVTSSQGEALRWRTGGIGKTEFLEFLRASDPPDANVAE